MENIIRERLVVLHQDIDSLNTEASVDALGVEGHSRQLQQTGAAIEALKGVLRQAEHEKVPPKPEPPAPMRVFVEGQFVGTLGCYEISTYGSDIALKMELTTTHEMTHELTRLAAERETLLGRVVPDTARSPAEAKEAADLLNRASMAADTRVALKQHIVPPRVVIPSWVSAAHGWPGVKTLQGQFGVFDVRVDPDLPRDEFRIEDNV